MTGANWFNLSPRNTHGRYPGKAVAMMAHMVFKVCVCVWGDNRPALGWGRLLAREGPEGGASVGRPGRSEAASPAPNPPLRSPRATKPRAGRGAPRPPKDSPSPASGVTQPVAPRRAPPRNTPPPHAPPDRSPMHHPPSPAPPTLAPAAPQTAPPQRWPAPWPPA